MLKQKSLILLFNICSFLLISLTLSACSFSYLYDKDTKQYRNEVYVDSIPELSGMILRQELSKYFPSKTNNTRYILQITTKLNSGLLLNNRSGFATQNQITFIANWRVINRLNNKVLFSNSSYYNTYYNIEQSSYSTENNKNMAIKLVAISTASDIAFKLIALLKQNNGDLTTLHEIKQAPTTLSLPNNNNDNTVTSSTTPDNNNTNIEDTLKTINETN
ncbi:hypothetical protein ACFX5K_04765 [Rickettsiales bacterium LUAb2]